MDTRQVHEYPDTSISKVLTILKWRMTTMLNRKLLQMQKVQNHFAGMLAHWVTYSVGVSLRTPG